MPEHSFIFFFIFIKVICSSDVFQRSRFARNNNYKQNHRCVLLPFFKIFLDCVFLLNAVARPIDVALGDLMDTLCLFVKSNHHCLPAFYSYSNNSEHSIIFFSANSYATVVACIFPTTKHNTCLLSSLCDSHGLFPCLLELFCGEDLLKHIQLHNLDLPACSYSAKVSFCRPQNYQQLFGVIVRFVLRK